MRWLGLLLLAWVLAACEALDPEQTIEIRPDEIGVVVDTATGRLQDPLLPGMHTIDAVRQRVVFYPTFVQVYRFTGDAGDADFSTRAPAISALTADNVTATVSLGIAFRLDPAAVNAVHRQWAGTPGDYRAGYIRVVARLITETVISTYNAVGLYGIVRQDLEARLAAPLARELAANGFILERVDVYDVVLPPEVVRQIEGGS